MPPFNMLIAFPVMNINIVKRTPIFLALGLNCIKQKRSCKVYLYPQERTIPLIHGLHNVPIIGRHQNVSCQRLASDSSIRNY